MRMDGLGTLSESPDPGVGPVVLTSEGREPPGLRPDQPAGPWSSNSSHPPRPALARGCAGQIASRMDRTRSTRSTAPPTRGPGALHRPTGRHHSGTGPSGPRR